LFSALFENKLEILLRTFFGKGPNKDGVVDKDEDLFDQKNAILGTFSAKITMSYRLGLISKEFYNQLNKFRKLRNEFTHNVKDCTFENQSVSDRAKSFIESCSFIDKRDNLAKSLKDQFKAVIYIMLIFLDIKAETMESIIEPCETEFAFTHEVTLEKNGIRWNPK
jgi:DNA-binding MltR family transcriptional regulator